MAGFATYSTPYTYRPGNVFGRSGKGLEILATIDVLSRGPRFKDSEMAKEAILKTKAGKFLRVTVDYSDPVNLICKGVNGEVAAALPWWTLTAKRGGEENRSLVLISNGEELVVADQSLIRKIKKAAPVAVQNQLSSAVDDFIKHRRTTTSRIALYSIGAVAAVLIGMNVLGYIMAQAADSLLPPSVDVSLGESAFESFAKDYKEVKREEIREPLLHVVQSLAQALNLEAELKLHVFETTDINALAFPGGHVVIFSGLLREAGSFDEIAGVLAHELEHVKLRHGIKNAVQSLGVVALFQAAKFFLGIGDFAFDGLIPGLIQSNFSRIQEAEADALAIPLARKAGFRPSGLIDFFKRIEKYDVALLSLLSSHPMTGERIIAAEALLKDSDSAIRSPLHAQWKTFHERLIAQGN